MPLLLLLALLLPATVHATPPEVVVSIKPLHALTAVVMEGVATPHLLLRGGESPHSYALRPSDARALAQAQLVVWVGPELETFLEKTLQGLARKARSLPLLHEPGLLLLRQREGGSWEADMHHEHGGQHHATNPHIWLDPHNAEKIALRVAAALAQIDPENARVYQQNAEQLAMRLQQLDRRLATRLSPLRLHPYLVFHDAYHYFEQRYQLGAIGSITVSPERLPGARRISEIRKKIVSSQALCIFSEPQFKPQLVDSLIGDSGIRTGVLDPLGADLQPGPSAYFDLLDQLAAGLESCLASSRSD